MAVGIFYNKEQLNKNFKLVKWSSNVEYKTTNLVVYNNKIFKCITDHTSTDFVTDETNWELYVGGTDFKLDEWKTDTNYELGDYVYINSCLYKSLQQHISSSNFEDDELNWELIIDSSNFKIDEWEQNKQYEISDVVLYNTYEWECLEAHNSGTVFEDNQNKWLCRVKTYSVTQEQYDNLVTSGYIDATNKHLYIIIDSDNEESDYEEEVTESNQWLIQHGLGTEYYKLNITCLDSEGNYIFGDINTTLSTLNLLVIDFCMPISGKIYLKK